MSQQYHIEAYPLPLNQNFNSLIAEGFSYIQQISGNNWTNLNPSDPGVTILEQVCYALTELGYCSDFPIEDILSEEHRRLEIDNQFYLPQDIFTTSPLTINDYRKYLIDGIKEIENALIIPLDKKISLINGVYQTYILAHQEDDNSDSDQVCQKAFYYLNKARNIGELFLMPKLLQAQTYMLAGEIEVEDEQHISKLLIEIKKKINHYIFPRVTPSGYKKLLEEGFSSDKIFNGPLLKNGWIRDEDFGNLKDKIHLFEITDLISNIKGVENISLLDFITPDKQITDSITARTGEIPVLDILESVKCPEPENGESQSASLKVYCKGRLINSEITQRLSLIQNLYQSEELRVTPVEAIQIAPSPPEGKFRDINSYYSIQNTFPEIYAVGPNEVHDNAPAHKIAQSRQLKGYLTLFDQVIANQFSQLANIATLFSFKNTLIGNPSDRNHFYETKDAYQKKHLKYPVPYQLFSPTYFYQSLYEIPGIKSLLKGDQTFDFGEVDETNKEQEIQSWKRYKEDPYNPYIWGLMQITNDESISLERRSAMLDHLLARHGESPVMIDSLINGSSFTNEKLKDKVIFKSLYLQNLGLLSYFRQKAYNYQAANLLPDKLAEFNLEAEQADAFQHDFIFNSEEFDKISKLNDTDFTNYASIELKMSLFLGLVPKYFNFLEDKNNSENAIKIAQWMIYHRKGLIFIERNLLFQSAIFNIILRKKGDSDGCWFLNPLVPFKDLTGVLDFLKNPQNLEKLSPGYPETIEISKKGYLLYWDKQNSEGAIFKEIKGSDIEIAIVASWGKEKTLNIDEAILENLVYVFFPCFIWASDNLCTNKEELKPIRERAELFLRTELPAQVNFQTYFLNAEKLSLLIPAFAQWHNS
ncbi:MAG: hypothetical protein KDD99_00995, partial [Bacteroidetes bacterium]|nr:hypothetical protein [Bacteroidota bacterium]